MSLQRYTINPGMCFFGMLQPCQALFSLVCGHLSYAQFANTSNRGSEIP